MAKRRRSYRRRLRARRIGGRRKYGMLSKLVTPLSFAATFMQQITEKDFQGQNGLPNWSPMDKARWLISDAVGRVTGWYPDPIVGAGIASQGMKVNLPGIINKWTGLGILGILYSKFGDGLPGRSTARKLGAGALAGGIVGGIFDNPTTERFAGYTGSQVPKGAQQGISGTGIANE